MVWLLSALARHTKDILSPARCAFCQRALPARTYWCNDCVNKLPPLASQKLRLTPRINIDVYAATEYNVYTKKLIMRKHAGNIDGCYALAQLIHERAPWQILSCDALVPIPLHWWRQAYRGFNQAHEIATLLTQHHPCTVQNLVRRTRATAYQASLTIEQRAHNVHNAFALSTRAYKQDYTNKHLVLVDDLMTTGNTLIQAGRALLALKPASISALVACRAIERIAHTTLILHE